MPKLVVMLRVKDGIFFVPEWLECFEKLADEIVVLDNGSTDGTYEMLKANPMVKEIQQLHGYNEGRDKNIMYALARKRNPDWCLWLDVDEIFEPSFTRSDLERLMSNKMVNMYGFRRFHFIDRTSFAASWYRLKYISGHDRMLWRESSAGYFQDLIIDSPNVKGIKGLKVNTSFRLKHLGYINKEIVDKKADLYRSIVPEKEATFKKMYLQNEPAIKWTDNRSNIKVIGLNWLLNCIQFITLFPRGYRKLSVLLKKKSTSQGPAKKSVPEAISKQHDELSYKNI